MTRLHLLYKGDLLARKIEAYSLTFTVGDERFVFIFLNKMNINHHRIIDLRIAPLILNFTEDPDNYIKSGRCIMQMMTSQF